MPYEHIWRAWAQTTADSGSVQISLVCHAKFPDKVQSEWLQRRMLLRHPRIGRGDTYADPEFHTRAPEWGSIQLTRAMIDCLAAGMKIGVDRETDPRFASDRYLVETGDKEEKSNDGTPPVDTFIFISETCLPVRTIDECVAEIYGGNEVEGASETGTSSAEDGTQSLHQSWVKARNRNTPGTPRNKYERDQFTDINRLVPQHFRWKADQWLLLSRSHASAVLNIDQHMRPPDQLWSSFSKISASDEMYFPTALAILGILKEEKEGEAKEQPLREGEGETSSSATTSSSSKQKQPQYILDRQVTYVDWSQGMRNPATYDKGLRDFVRVARLARENGSLFARKFVPFVQIPGQEDPPAITGAISTEEWKSEVTKMAKAAEASKEEEKGKRSSGADPAVLLAS